MSTSMCVSSLHDSSQHQDQVSLHKEEESELLRNATVQPHPLRLCRVKTAPEIDRCWIVNLSLAEEKKLHKIEWRERKIKVRK